MPRKILFGLFASILMLVNGCYYDNEEDLYPGSYCDTVDVTYSRAVKAIVESNCALPTCHVPGGDGNGDYNQFANVAEKAADGRFLASIKGLDGAIAMPPVGYTPLRDCQIRQIELWIASGAEDN